MKKIDDDLRKKLLRELKERLEQDSIDKNGKMVIPKEKLSEIIKREREESRRKVAERGKPAVKPEGNVAPWRKERLGLLSMGDKSSGKPLESKIEKEPYSPIEHNGKIIPVGEMPKLSREEAIRYTGTLIPGAKVSYDDNMNAEEINEYNWALSSVLNRYKPPYLKNLGSEDLMDDGAVMGANYRFLVLNHDGDTEGVHSISRHPDKRTLTLEEIRFYDEKLKNGIDVENSAFRKQWFEDELKQIDNAEMPWRETIANTPTGATIFDALLHDFGHVLHFSRVKDKGGDYNNDKTSVGRYIRYIRNKARRNKHIVHLSEYADHDNNEFFAECFAAYCKGEPLPEYIVRMIEVIVKPYAK